MWPSADSAEVLCRLAAGLRALGAGLVQDLSMWGLLLAAERRPEVTQALPERAPNLGQTLRAEHQQRDHKNEQKMCWLKDVSDHCWSSLAAGGVRGLGKPKDPLNLNIAATTVACSYCSAASAP